MLTSKHLCPLCLRPNNCHAHDITQCWCTSTKVPKELIAAANRAQKNEGCICQQCIKNFEKNRELFAENLQRQTPRYTMAVTASQEQIDLNNHVNNTVYLQWMQDVATAHWNLLASKEERENIFWVVRKHEIEYRKEALLGDTLYLTTWIEEATRLRHHRRTEIYHSDGSLAASALTIWCPIDSKTHKIIRAPKEVEEKFLATPYENFTLI